MANTPQFTMRLDPVLREKLEAIAKRQRRSLGNMVEVICREYVAEDDEATTYDSDFGRIKIADKIGIVGPSEWQPKFKRTKK
jgi:hypothetical protein